MGPVWDSDMATYLGPRVHDMFGENRNIINIQIIFVGASDYLFLMSLLISLLEAENARHAFILFI